MVLHQNITSGLPENLDSLVINLFNLGDETACILDDIYISEGYTSENSGNFIELYNSGQNDCTLKGYTLSNNNSFGDFTFDNTIIESGEYWVGYQDEDLSFNFDLNVLGDEIWLGDSLGSSNMVILNPSLYHDNVQLSQSFISDGSGCYTLPTPGEENSECVTLDLKNDIVPNKTSLIKNFPNPFNPQTSILYFLDRSKNISISIYNSKGELVRDLFSGNKAHGHHTISWSGVNDSGVRLSSGIYFCIIEMSDVSISKKMIMLK